MKNQSFDINKMRVASPCNVGWETMTGDERVRRCDSCELNIYNIAEMTKPEVLNLVDNHEGRLCIRLYKRADGTVLTKNCPVGFRAYQKRVARFAGATLATILGLFSVGFGQTKDKNPDKNSNVKIVRTEIQNEQSVLNGTIVDITGALIPGAEIKLYESGKKKPRKVVSDSEGKYVFQLLSKGIYKLEINVAGFKLFSVGLLKIKDKEEIDLTSTLEIDEETVTVGIYGSEPLIDMSSSEVKTVITREMIDRIPH